MLTVRRALFRRSLAGPLLGPSVCLHLGVQVSVPGSACFSRGSCWPCCLPHCVRVTAPATEGGRRVCSGPSRGLGTGTFGSAPLPMPCLSASVSLHPGQMPSALCCMPSPLLGRFGGSLSPVQGLLAPSPSPWSSHSVYAVTYFVKCFTFLIIKEIFPCCG